MSYHFKQQMLLDEIELLKGRTDRPHVVDDVWQRDRERLDAAMIELNVLSQNVVSVQTWRFSK
jgi:hypothetical protein